MLKFICYPKCTTCQRAKNWLDENNVEYELRDIKTDNPTLSDLAFELLCKYSLEKTKYYIDM